VQAVTITKRQGARQVERWTRNHWHGRLETYPLRYQVDASWVTNWPLYSKWIMRGSLVEQVLKQEEDPWVVL